MNVKELIDQLEPRIQERVEKAYKRYNQVTREAMRNVTRLRLQKGKRKFIQGNEQLETRVPVQVKLAAPEEIESLVIPADGVIAATLSKWKPELEMLRGSSSEIFCLLMNGTKIDCVDNEVLYRPDIVNLTGSLEDAGKLAEKLLAEIDAFDVVGWLFHEMDGDVLGRYYYSHHGLTSDDGSARIELYSGIIALVSSRLGIEVEDLTVVVLAHELAHAYTHLGFDSNNHRWVDDDFYEAQHELKEGLAQYYGRLALEHLADIIPGAIPAYEKLLEKQPPAYQVHREWLDRDNPEAVRHALVTLRRENFVGIDRFNDYLHRPAK
ncbi:MAG: hypothetical protein HXX17_15595 [Geobacteraceae bacterium]|nr:hypothetical protein [Geobacteraceae bacterium]